jgi:protein ImuB
MRLLQSPEPIEAIASVPEGPPVRFRWRKKLHVVVHVEGPERISDEWWNSNEIGHQTIRHTRDYFRIEDDKGYRYWLYRQGLYASETNLPRWYMHGIFS